ncbi:MAG TPA: DUF5916 domain-containing protein [Chitinophagaceae bacterium]|nr:DUF5916 domain-containing protein [Chitinophagaceae bacterium]
MKLRRIICLPLLLISCTVFSQEKTLQAIKPNQLPKIDGNLGDAVWQSIPEATDFIQNYPSAGQPASQKTSVKVIYDNSAVYISAYLYDDPALIRKQITARDEELQKDVDYFAVFFDTYNDNQNGFQFVVSSANVQSDARLGPNLGSGGGFGEFGDKTWDAVWESKVQVQKDGWTIEMKIPYISLRFAKKDLQDWGIQFLRQVRRLNEISYWNMVDPNVNGFVNQFGLFTGLKELQPPLRLSFSPYVSTGYRRSPAVGTGFTDTWLGSGGLDVKYGVNESFTLDATLIPDFGQVVSDNVINNLSPYEVRFQENRQFFTEGTEIFNKAGLFYSRRVGAIPSKYNTVRYFVADNPEWEISRNPSVTQLYNAAKFSGRTEKKLGIGIFNAVTAPMHARLRNKNSGKDSTIETEPLSNYNIIVFDQALKGRSSVTFTNTNVIRNAEARDANVSALDFSFFDKKNVFNTRGTLRYSKIFSTDPYDGFNTTLRFAKVSGKWQYALQGNIESAHYDPRDLGFLAAPNDVTVNGSLSYNRFTPTKNFLTYNYRLSFRDTRLYKPAAFGDLNIEGSGFWIFKNFWDINLRAGYTPHQHDYFVLGDPATYQRFVKRPMYGYTVVSGSSDSRKKLYARWSFFLTDFFNSGPHKNYHAAEGGLRYRFSNRFSLDLSHRHEAESDYIISAGREINNEPIVAYVDFTDITSVLAGIYNFTPRVNLTLRARHYLSRVKFNRFANVDMKGNTIPRAGTTSFDNVNVFNVDAFLTWDFRPGSRLILGYKNWLGDEEIVTVSGKNNYLRNLSGIFDLRHGNELTLRFIYFLNYNQLRHKH